MSHSEPLITLDIKEAGDGDGRVFLYEVQLDGEVIAANQTLSVADSQTVRELSQQYNALFERRYAPGLVSDDLKVIGGQLFNIWLKDAWPPIAARLQAGTRRALVIASEIAEILNLPWELLCPVAGDFVALDQRFTVRRLPQNGRPLGASSNELPPRPLRILFMACAPREETQLNFEREEEAIIRAIGNVGRHIAFDSGDAGSFDELMERINDFQPHIVHLTGHGIVADDGLGYFAFEDERGKTDLRSSIEMRERLFSGSGVQLAFISGCQTGKAPPIAAMNGICQALVGEEIPMAIGWAASIADNIATQFAEVFYKTIAAGRTVDQALTQARLAILKICDDQGYPGWTLPVLYCATRQSRVFDANPQRPEEPPPRPNVVQQPLPGIAAGYTPHFVGRRRETQRLLPALREGSLHTLIFTGLGGAGKSTLATRLARKLEALGFRLIPVPSTKESPLRAARLLQACSDAFLDAGLRDAYDTLNDAKIAVDARLRFIVSTLNKHRFLLVLDNFEENLDETTRRIIDSELAEFYKHLISYLVGESRVFITTRYLPADAGLPATAHEEELGDFPESAFFKFMLYDKKIERRYYANKLPRELLSELHRLLGGTPRFLGQMREALKTMTADELRDELQNVKLNTNATASVLQRQRDEYCEAIFTARLYSYLSEASRRALSRAAVYSIAVNVEGLAAATGLPIETTRGYLREWQNYALAYPERERGIEGLWSVYALLHGWLLSPERLSEDERRAAHLAAGDFLREMVDNKRAGELGLNWVECLTEARAQYLAAGEYTQARDATNHISESLLLQGLYKELAEMNEEMLDYEAHPDSMYYIGRAYLDRADYQIAREWFQQSLIAAGDDLPREAALAWHQLATIDLRGGSYEAAREKFQKALAMRQQSGHRAGEATTWHQLATIDLYLGDYAAAREKFHKSLEIKQQSGDRAGEATTWHQLATIDLNVGDYTAAREKFIKALAMRQQSGDRAGEAATWHQLATIDLNVGDYTAAREKFIKALTMRQQIGDRAGEAATFYQLGFVAAALGRLAEGMRLVAVCYLIDQSIGHGDTKSDFQTLSQMAGQLGYTQEQFDAMLQEVSKAYKADRGWGLIEAAFKSA